MRKTKLLFATLAMSMVLSSTTLAGTWQPQDNGQWMYQNDNGAYSVNCWQWIDGDNDGIAENYYFDENGLMLTNCITPDGYTVDVNGAWIIDGVIQTQQTAVAVSNITPSSTAPKEAVASTPVGDTVWISGSGKKYHSNASCSGMKNPTKVSLSDAQAAGRTACSKCY